MFELLLTDLTRLWHDIVARPSGPMAFRFVLQPVMAILLAIRDGSLDAKTGRTPYFWTIVNQPAERKLRLHEGIRSTARLLALGLLMEVIYQTTQLRAFYIGEALIIVFVLAFAPYLLLRGPAARLIRRWHEHHPPHARS